MSILTKLYMYTCLRHVSMSFRGIEFNETKTIVNSSQEIKIFSDNTLILNRDTGVQWKAYTVVPDRVSH